jgi:hypothetical protein
MTDLPGQLWLLFTIAGATVPVVTYVLIRAVHADIRAMRPQQGQCENCGYDIRATLDRCP